MVQRAANFKFSIRFCLENSLEEKLLQERCFISSRPIKLPELKEVCDRLHLNKDAGFIQEFKVHILT